MLVTAFRHCYVALVRWLLARVTTNPGVGWRPSRKRNDLHFK